MSHSIRTSESVNVGLNGNYGLFDFFRAVTDSEREQAYQAASACGFFNLGWLGGRWLGSLP